MMSASCEAFLLMRAGRLQRQRAEVQSHSHSLSIGSLYVRGPRAEVEHAGAAAPLAVDIAAMRAETEAELAEQCSELDLDHEWALSSAHLLDTNRVDKRAAEPYR